MAFQKPMNWDTRRRRALIADVAAWEILDKLKLLKQGTRQRSAAEQLVIIGFGCFHNAVGISRMNWAPPVLSTSRWYQLLWSGPGVDDITGFYCTKKRQ